MIEILPAIGCNCPGAAESNWSHIHSPGCASAIGPAPRRIINLVAMKEYEAWVGFPDNASFWECHDMATAWAERRDFQFDQRSWTETEA